ncbi:MAG: hypothetical protein NZ108_08140, partial [Bacteroidia bacterium]|nr:hypothetical protein [Bacteroidia bacterium]
EGPFAYVGLSYGLITGHYFDENYQLSDRLLIHKPGIGIAGGYQWILGLYKNFAIDVFGGMEYYYVVKNADTSQRNFFKNINNINVYCGAQIGFAFRQRDRHW